MSVANKKIVCVRGQLIMNIKIKRITQAETDAWDTYVNAHPNATLYHLSTWKNVIEKAYNLKTYYLMAVNSSQLKVEDPPCSWRTQSSKKRSRTDYEPSAINYQLSTISYELNPDNVIGILPLVHLKHFLFGNSLISIPFFDIGGILANDEETEKALLSEAIKLGYELKANNIELRHIAPIASLNQHQIPDEQLESSAPFSQRRGEVSQLHQVTEKQIIQ